MDKNEIIRVVREQKVRFIRLQVTDIFGQLKNVAITASQIEKAMDNQIAFDGSSIEGFVRIHESDQYLWPDPDTFKLLPWDRGLGAVARLICDVHNPDGTPFVGVGIEPDVPCPPRAEDVQTGWDRTLDLALDQLA